MFSSARRCDYSTILHGIPIILLLGFAAVPCEGRECECAQKVFSADTNSGAIEDDTQGTWCMHRHCEFLVEPNPNKSITLSIRGAILNEFNTVKIHQYLIENNTEVVLPAYFTLNSTYGETQSNPIFTTAKGVGFIVRSSVMPNQLRSFFSFLFYRSAPDEGTCPFPLLRASESYSNMPTITASGDVGKRCPLRIISSTPGRKIYLSINSLGGFANPRVLMGGQYLHQRGSNTSFILSEDDSVDLMLEKAIPDSTPLNATFKEMTNDPCLCDETNLVVGTEPVYVTSPGFPDFYCSNFKCTTKFRHENNTEDDAVLAFVATIHFMDTIAERDFLRFSSDGYHLEDLSGVHRNLTLVLAGYSMEVEFSSGDVNISYGYNMTVKSVRLPSECLCPHEKGFKTMLPDGGSVTMSLPNYCTVVYCKWVVPRPVKLLQFSAVFNFTTKYEKLSVSAKNGVHWSAPLIGGKPTKRHWKMFPNNESVIILFRRDIPESYVDQLRTESFLVTWRTVGSCKCPASGQHTAIFGEWRQLTSPAYPSLYCDNVSCVYRISAPAGHHVLMNITDFHTESYNDFLTIYDGISTNEKTLGRFHGRKRFSPIIKSSSATVTLVFSSDHDISFEGFQIMYIAEADEKITSRNAALITDGTNSVEMVKET